ncbi:MAG: hypothetical protein ACRDNC_07125 [Gaiellaceae bacterium]
MRSRSRRARSGAREAADELEPIADEHRAGERRTPALEGTVQLAWGLAERDWEAQQGRVDSRALPGPLSRTI